LIENKNVYTFPELTETTAFPEAPSLGREKTSGPQAARGDDLVFRFATGTGRRLHEWPIRKFDHHRLQQCLALWARALVLLSLLPPLLVRMRSISAGTDLHGRRGRVLPSTLLLSPDFMRLQAHARTADRPNPDPTAELPAMPVSTLLVIARRHICGAFMHARTVEAGSCPLGRR